jgi:hypothetical protein
LSQPEQKDWGVVLGTEATSRVRQLPDGRVMSESRITVTKEAMEQMWTGYRCAACLQEFAEFGLGPWPKACPVCHFPVRKQQEQRLREDFVGEVKAMEDAGQVIEREVDFLDRQFFVPKPQIHVRRDP